MTKSRCFGMLGSVISKFLSKMSAFLAAGIASGVLAPSSLTSAEPCAETVIIDSVTYRVNSHWCGGAIASSEMPSRKSLVLLPQELTFEDYEIAVRRETRDAFIKMAQAAGKDSILLAADSGFRSRAYQQKIIRDRMAAGATFAEIIRSVAPPGYSEHHTGRALDLVPSEIGFASARTYLWLKEHAAEFGFYETLPRDSGHSAPWEPWHWSWQGDRDSSAIK